MHMGAALHPSAASPSPQLTAVGAKYNTVLVSRHGHHIPEGQPFLHSPEPPPHSQNLISGGLGGIHSLPAPKWPGEGGADCWRMALSVVLPCCPHGAAVFWFAPKNLSPPQCNVEQGHVSGVPHGDRAPPASPPLPAGPKNALSQAKLALLLMELLHIV